MGYFKEFFPSKDDYRPLAENFRHDLIAGITVGVVALPLALGFGITTGAGAASGLVTAIIAGIFAAIFGGSNFQVSGPTGAMTVVLVPIVSKYGVDALAPLGIFAGILIVVLGFIKVGKFIDRVPLVVMEGFTLGIALVIALQQVPLVLGIPRASGSHTVLVAINTISNAISNSINWTSISVVILALAIKFTWPKLNMIIVPKVHIPASIVAVFLTTLIVKSFGLRIATIGEIPRKFDVIGNYFDSLNVIPMNELVYSIIVIALLGSIESLLSARVADGMAHKFIDHDQKKHQPNRELFGQGLATIAASLLGGMPATGAIARTSVNIRAGAKSRLASIVHAFFLLLVVLLLAPIVAIIPTAALAGVLLGTSYRIANPKSITEALRTTYEERAVFIVTAGSVLAIDLIWGLVIGLFTNFVLKKLLSSRG